MYVLLLSAVLVLQVQATFKPLLAKSPAQDAPNKTQVTPEPSPNVNQTTPTAGGSKSDNAQQTTPQHPVVRNGVMDWFARNASAIQAIASVVGVLIATVLAGVTYWYVRVTREMARSSAEQVQQFRSAA